MTTQRLTDGQDIASGVAPAQQRVRALIFAGPRHGSLDATALVVQMPLNSAA
jgi:hypothetical protein